MIEHLYVYRDWTSENNGAWRLLWAVHGATSFVHAEGECSKRLFKTMRAAKADGLRRFNQYAKRWNFGDDFA